MALVRRIGFTRFNRWGDNLGRLTVSAATHADALDGTDELKITCAEDLVKGDRVVWIDLQGVCHEHIVDTIDRVHDDEGAPETQAVCINSVNETWDDWLDDKRPSGSVSVALTSILADTRWEVGTCDQGGAASRTFYHESVREGLAGIIETWGGELETLIVHDGARIVSRRVGVRAKRGNQNSAKRFTWTKDLVSVKRSVASDNPKTRVYGYGKGVETEGGGYGRRLTFGDINGGKDYVEDAEATTVWGHPDGEGGILPAVASYVNEQCEDAAQLLQETKDYLEQVKEPKVTYTASVIDLYAFGRSWEGVGVGDDVAIIDKGFSAEGVRLHGRVSQIERDLLTGDATVTFGTLTDAMADMWQSVANALKSNSQQNALYDAAAGTSASWLQQLQAAINAQFNAVGTYKVETFELGTVYSNVPIDAETGLPLKSTSGMWAVNINGMGIRLAASLASDGQWNWRTFITGAQVSADCINAGTMRADRIRAGLLTDEVGANYWDLETGEFQLSPNTKYGNGGWTVDGVIEELHSGMTQNRTNIVGLKNDFQTRNKELDETISSLDKTVDDIAKDGIVTEAEKAAVNKILQTVQKDKEDLSAQYKSLSSNKNLQVQFKEQALEPIYNNAFGEGGAFYALMSAISDVTNCSTADTLDAAMSDYKSAYENYSSAVAVYSEVARRATSMIAQEVAKADAEKLVDKLDESLEQQEIFNRLTNDGANKGIYMSNGELYVNATYLKSGTIGDGQGKNYWSLTSGYFQTTYGVIGGLSIDNNKLYRYKLTLNSNTSGLYIGTDGFSVGGGTCYTAMANGYLYGGTAEDITGYVGFNNYNTSSRVYGARLAGKGCICLLTDDWIGVGPYKDRGEYVECKTGRTGSVTLVGNLQSSWTNMSLTGTYNVSNLCQNLSMQWTNWTLNFDHGLMVTAL